jgi:hypothetical protein
MAGRCAQNNSGVGFLFSPGKKFIYPEKALYTEEAD